MQPPPGQHLPRPKACEGGGPRAGRCRARPSPALRQAQSAAQRALLLLRRPRAAGRACGATSRLGRPSGLQPPLPLPRQRPLPGAGAAQGQLVGGFPPLSATAGERRPPPALGRPSGEPSRPPAGPSAGTDRPRVPGERTPPQAAGGHGQRRGKAPALGCGAEGGTRPPGTPRPARPGPARSRRQRRPLGQLVRERRGRGGSGFSPEAARLRWACCCGG